jgi:hypothetical protein
MSEKTWDGFYFIPGENDNEINLSFWTLIDEYSNGSPIDGTKIGDMYHVALFKKGQNGSPEFDGSFDAIFADPQVWVEGLIGAEIYGCICRKTDKSVKWFEDYLTNTLRRLMIKKLSNLASAIANN